MMNFKFEWKVSDGYNGKEWNSHTLTIANEHTFCIRARKQITFPGTNNPTYIDSTYITPTDKSLEQCCKHILETSYGNWWTGDQRVPISQLNGRKPELYSADFKFAVVDFFYEFPKSESELELKLSIAGF